MKRFRLVAGNYDNVTWEQVGNREVKRVKRFVEGDVIESEEDLCEKFNGKGLPPKFILLAEDASKAKSLAVMTDEELKEYAGELEIDVSDCETRKQLVEKLMLPAQTTAAQS